MDKKSSYFPMFFDIEDKKVVVFGAGNIAHRRVLTLLNTGCDILLVAPNVNDKFCEIKSEKIKIIKDCYDKKYIQGAFMVLAITDNKDVNNEIYEECKKQNIIVNVASDKQKCDFFFPSLICKEGYTVAVCGDGKNHSLIKNIGDKLREFLR